MLKQKIQTIQKALRKQGMDSLVIGNFGHQVRCDMMYYLLLKHLELGAMHIPARGKPTLWGISFEVPQLKRAHPELTVKPYNASLDKLLSIKYKTKERKQCAIRESSLPITALKKIRKCKNIKMAPFKNEEHIFAIKLPEEIKRLQKAAQLTDILFTDLIKNWKRFRTESDAAQFLLTQTAALGVESSFSPIIASGAHAADPHHEVAHTKIQKGFCVIDMGVRYKGYCSDMTRTVYVGKPNKKDTDLYYTLLDAQKETCELVKPGAAVRDIDIFCREKLGPKLNKEFIHSLGHGLGTQVHEWPRVSANVDTDLQAGMLITIEPGVYRAGAYGIRIEDDVLVTKQGHRILNGTTKELILV